MTKVAFFIDNDNIKNVDCKDIIHGNPGIGGSEYMIILVAYLLSLRSNNIEVTIFCTNRGILPDNVSYLLCEDFGNGYSLALSKHFNYFVFRHTDYYVNNYLKRIKLDNSLKLIPWCHNFCSYSSLRFYSRTDAVFKIICVGKEQMELYIDHKAYLKSDYIYNIVPAYKSECNYSLDDVKNRENIVTYVGSLVPEKGFLYLAKAWPSIVKEIPNAQLYVIGSGILYNRNQKLGRLE
jgi:glycosyltransferase involved in cell wall biosynthesis